MADTKISALTDGGAIQATDEFVIVRGTSNNKVTGDKIIDLIGFSHIGITFASSPYSASVGEFIEVDTSGGDVNVDLPSVIGSTGKEVIIKKTSSDGNKVNINAQPAETIDGFPTKTLNSQYQVLHVFGSAEWQVENDGSFEDSIIGDPGTEESGINVGGTIYDSVLKVSDINNANLAQFILHKHSTTIEPIMVTSRSNSDVNSHTSVTNGQYLYSNYVSGWAGTNYKLFGAIRFLVDTGTVSDTSAPGAIEFQVTPDGTVAPQTALTIRNDGTLDTEFAIKFNNASNPPYDEALIFYDNDNKAVSYYNDESDVTLQIGQENWIRVYNNSGSLITNGQAVYVTGSEVTEYRPTIALAQANTSTTSSLLGVATHDIENGTYGYVTQFGTVNDFDTSAFSPGDAIYLSSTVAGEFQTAPPVSPDFVVFVGYVLRSDVSAGKIFVTALGNTSGASAGAATELTEFARKGSPGTINKGEVVYISGYNVGQGVPEVELTDSSTDATMPAVGIANSSITNSTTGSFTISGLLTGLDTSAFSAGDELYVDSTTPGDLTNVKPTGTDEIQKVAICLRSNASNGILLVIGAGRSNDIPNFSAADKYWYGSTGGTAAEGDITAAGRALLDDADASAQRTTLNVPSIYSVQSITNAASPYSTAVFEVVLANATSGNIIVNLPTASGISGEYIIVKKTDSSSFTVTVEGNGAETIDGASNQVLTIQYESITVVSDGTNWAVI